MDCNDNTVKYSKIQIIDPPKDIIKWYRDQNYSPNKYSVPKLRDDVIALTNKELFYIKNVLLEEKMNDRLKNLILIEFKISNYTNANELIELLEKTEFMEIKIVVINRLIEIDNHSYKYFVESLIKPYTDIVFDIAFKALIKIMRKKDISAEILSLLENNYVSDPNDFSSLVQLMGYSKNGKILKYLYSYYEYFRTVFSNEDYYEGPLYAIKYYIKRNRITPAST